MDMLTGMNDPSKRASRKNLPANLTSMILIPVSKKLISLSNQLGNPECLAPAEANGNNTIAAHYSLPSLYE
jgi:hypothetical protein